MRFLDTNIILRHLLDDNEQMSKACYELFSQIENGELQVWTSDLAIAEVVFVLSNKKTYGFGRTAIKEALLPLIELPNLVLANKAHYERIFELYTTSKIDFIDCYHAVFVEQTEEAALYSYDRHFDEIQGITRIEPTPPQDDDSEKS